MNQAGNALLARAHALYAKRLTNEDYSALVNLHSQIEVFTYLKSSTSYSQYLENLSSQNFSRHRLERAVHRTQREKIITLCKFEKLLGEHLYKFYIRKSEIETILYSIYHLQTDKVIDLSAMPPFFQKEQCFKFEQLQNATNLEEFANALSGTPYEPIVRSIIHINSPWVLSVIENSLYNYLYTTTSNHIKKIYKGKVRDEILNHISFLSDMTMITSLCRLNEHYASFDGYKMITYISSQSNFTEKELKRLSETTTKDEVLDIVYSSYYKKYFPKDDIYNIEHKARIAAAKKCVKDLRYSQNPIVCMLCYCHLAENEIRNITHIIEGINYKLSPDEILKLIVKGETKCQ